MDEVTTKRCTKCSEAKAVEDFPKDRQKRDGLGSQCRRCKNATALAWNRRNPDRVRDNQARWLAEKPDHRKAWVAEWYARNAEKIRQQAAARRLAKPEQYRASERRRYYADLEATHRRQRAKATRVWRERPEHMRERQRAQYAKNPEPAKIASRRSRAARAAAPGDHSPADVLWLFQVQRSRCAYCRAKLGQDYEVDHIRPISKGGSNDRRNLQLTCMTCNRRKHAKDPLVFARGIGRLL